MSTKWLWLIVAVSVLYLDPSVTSAEDANSDDGDGASSQDEGNGEDTSLAEIDEERSLQKYLPDVVLNLLDLPRSLAQHIAALPRSVLEKVTDWGKQVMANLTEAAVAKGWEITKNYVLPWADDISVKVADKEDIPSQLKTMLNSFHSMYVMMKLFGYMKPS